MVGLLRRVRDSTIADDAYDDVDSTDPRPGGCLGKLAQNDRATWNVFEASNVLKIEMVVLGRVGIEIGLSRIDDYFVEQPNFYELMKCVVDGRQRDANARFDSLCMKRLGRHVTIGVSEKKPCQREPLPGRAETYQFEPPQSRGAPWFCHLCVCHALS